MKGSIEILRDAGSLDPFYAPVKTRAYKQEAPVGLVADAIDLFYYSDRRRYELAVTFF